MLILWKGYFETWHSGVQIYFYNQLITPISSFYDTICIILFPRLDLINNIWFEYLESKYSSQNPINCKQLLLWLRATDQCIANLRKVLSLSLHPWALFSLKSSEVTKIHLHGPKQWDTQGALFPHLW